MSYTKSLLTDQERRELIQKLAAELEAAKAELDRLRAIERDRDAVCNSYAAENQRLSDEIDRLRAENAELRETLKWSLTMIEMLNNGPIMEADREGNYTVVCDRFSRARAMLAKTAKEGG